LLRRFPSVPFTSVLSDYSKPNWKSALYMDGRSSTRVIIWRTGLPAVVIGRPRWSPAREPALADAVRCSSWASSAKEVGVCSRPLPPPPPAPRVAPSAPASRPRAGTTGPAQPRQSPGPRSPNDGVPHGPAPPSTGEQRRAWGQARAGSRGNRASAGGTGSPGLASPAEGSAGGDKHGRRQEQGRAPSGAAPPAGDSDGGGTGRRRRGKGPLPTLEVAEGAACASPGEGARRWSRAPPLRGARRCPTSEGARRSCRGWRGREREEEAGV
jgi:hypothetical protein